MTWLLIGLCSGIGVGGQANYGFGVRMDTSVAIMLKIKIDNIWHILINSFCIYMAF